MKIIVPLAGPDYFSSSVPKGLKPSTNGKPHLLFTLSSRAWFGSITSDNYYFVFIDSPLSRAFYENQVSKWLPNSKVVYLSKATNGAALTLLAAVAISAGNEKESYIVDLADINFSSNHIPFEKMSNNNIGAMGLYFNSQNPIYSYFELGKNNYVKKTIEKKVISNLASAGVYGFRNSTILIDSISHSLKNYSKLMYKDLLYICPLINGVISTGLDVYISKVENVNDIKLN